MAIGMSYDEFWYGLPYLVKAYKRSYDYKRQEQNQMMWLQGIYNLKAFTCVIEGAFSKSNKNKYPEKPLDIFPKPKTDREIEKEKERQKVVDYFSALKLNWDRKQKDNKHGND